MTVEEIFDKLSSHLVLGLMTHEQFCNYYDFLGLQGYKRCHEYHYMKENLAYRGICRYYINHYNKLIPESKFENPEIIPANWYKYTRFDVDANTKKNAVKSGLQKWKEWETTTKKLYEQMFKELMNIDEVAAACKVKELVHDVDMELKKIDRYILEKEAVNYDIGHIISEQKHKHEKYKKKAEKMGINIC